VNHTRTPLSGMSAVKLALMARQTRAQAAQALRSDPIAIVGMGCRLPGGANTPESLWRSLCDGVQTAREVPSDRWNGDAWYDPDLSATAKTVTKRGSFLDHIDYFDSDYFGIIPREADRMDPQQRLFLEVAIEALDDAGLTQPQVAGTRTGVYVASYHNDYAQLQYGDPEAIDPRTLTGTLHSVLANRLSWFLDLRGPSVSIDSACSASLVAVHLACQSLRMGECDIAVTGGVSLIIAPELLVSMSKVGFMAPDGRCKTFDALADGFGRGEGCSVVVLKRLADAIGDRDRILGVVRGSAVNQDGRSILLAAPNGLAQEALIREALESAQVEPERVGFVETHGTGTALGDPIEVEAIAATIGQAVEGADPCLLGSIKANLGHLEAAAGVTGLIKAALALCHASVPGQPNFQELNPHIKLIGTRLAVPKVLTPWPAGEQPRCAAVSSFGIGGTNGHVVLEEAPILPAVQTAVGGNPVSLLPLSAKSAMALHALAASWIDFLDVTPAPLADLCHTAAQRRTHYERRFAAVAVSKSEFSERLRQYVNEDPTPIVGGRRQAFPSTPRIGFVFSGQGPQWSGMGRELLDEEPIFRAKIDECDALLRPLSGWSLLEELASPPDRSRLGDTEVAQPALFALQIALAALWKSWGVHPDAVVGHSVGEIAALCVAGALDLSEAVRIVWHRGRIMQRATGMGRMAAASLSEAEARELVARFGDRLSVAAINAPRDVVLSGETAALDEALATLTERNLAHRMLPVHYAFHSAQLAPFQAEFIETLGAVSAKTPNIPVYSTVTGAIVPTDSLDARYFGRNMRDAVRFADAIGAMATGGFDLFLELSPHPVLSQSLSACLEASDRDQTILASLRRGRAERETMLRACGRLYEAGYDNLIWQAINPRAGSVTTLPAYPWQHRSHWIRARPAHDVSLPPPQSPGHPLLGHRIDVAGIQAWVFQGGSGQAVSWLADHRILGRLLLPAAAVIEMFSVAAGKALASDRPLVTSFSMMRPLSLPEAGEGEARWQVIARLVPDGGAELSLHEAVPEERAWRLVATAAATTATAAPAPDDLAGPSPTAITSSIAIDDVYDRFKTLGVDFGPGFRCLNAVTVADWTAQARIDLPDTLAGGDQRHLLHPVILDSVLQLCVLAASAVDRPMSEIFLPVGADSIQLRQAPPGSFQARVRISNSGGPATLIADAVLETEHGDPVATIKGLRFARADRATLAAMDQVDNDLYDLIWERASDLDNNAGPKAVPDPRAAGQSRLAGSFLLFADCGGTAASIEAAIVALGGQCWTVRPGSIFTRVTDRSWVIDPADPEHYRRCFEEAGFLESNPLQGALHCWSLDIPGPEAVPQSGPGDADCLGVGSVLHLAQCLARIERASSCRLRLLTRGAHRVNGSRMTSPRGAGVWGLAAVVAIEHPELGVRVVDLDPSDNRPDGTRLVTELLCDSEMRVALRGSQRWVPRLQRYQGPVAQPDKSGNIHPRRVEIAQIGSFDSLELRQITAPLVGPDEVRLRVLAAGINFRDVLTVLGMYPGDAPPLGVECAGVVTEVGAAVEEFHVGERVFGFAPASLGSEAIVPAAFLAPIPQGMRAEDAAAITIAFSTAYYGLYCLAKLGVGERVLIHAAAGGVGLAAVQLALRRGAEVFATAGSPAKRAMLRGLGVTAVMDSRSTAFSDEVLAATGGEGVHVVLNSLAGEFIPASLRALAPGGHFLELGKRGIWTEAEVEGFAPGVRYQVYDLGERAHADRGLLRPILDDIVGALADGSLHPLPVEVFELTRAGEAMRHMAQAKHTGKIVVRVSADTQPSKTAVPPFSANGTYLITGGLGGLGLETARWLARSGVYHLALIGRRPPGGAAEQCIRELESRGVAVRVFAADAANVDAMAAVIAEIHRTSPPLRGIVHAAGVVHDTVLLNQTWSEGREVIRGKSRGAWVLHELTQTLDLDFFVLYSAAGALLGAAGQGLYPAANVELDALAQYRCQNALPALSVAWGLWSGRGMAAGPTSRAHDVWQARGLGAIEPATGFAALERLLSDGSAYGAVIPIDWRQFLDQLPDGADRELFGKMRPPGARTRNTAAGARDNALLDRIRSLPSQSRRQALIDHLIDRANLVLGEDSITQIDTRIALREAGLDSLMAVELRNMLVLSTGAALPATLLFDCPTIGALADYLAPLCGIEAEASVEPPIALRDVAAGAKELEALSDAEAEALLLEELSQGLFGPGG
jgi:acyl transferase domain-containing protein